MKSSRTCEWVVVFLLLLNIGTVLLLLYYCPMNGGAVPVEDAASDMPDGAAPFVTPSMVEQSWQVADVDHLRGLVAALMQHALERKPRSTGHQFWQAMFVGDDPNAGRGGLAPEDAYMTADDTELLLCKADAMVDEAETRAAIQYAKENNVGVPMLTEYNCSYAGPIAGVARALNRYEHAIIGCTGSRDGVGFFDSGFAYVRGNMESGFLEYDDLAHDDPEWTGEEAEPNWDSELLQHVENLRRV